MADTPEQPMKAPPRFGQASEGLINRVHEGSDRGVPGGTPANGEARTKEAYSPVVSAAAFSGLKKDLGMDLLQADKWNPNTTEQKWWVNEMSASVAHLDKLPSSVQIKAKASIGTPDPVNKEIGTQIQDTGRKDAIYVGGSMNLLDTWDAKAKHMTALDQKGNLIKENGSEKYFDSVYKDGKVFNVDGKTVLQSQDNPQTGLKTFLIPRPDGLEGGMNEKNYASEMVAKALKQQGQPGKIEFPMYDKNVDQELTGIEKMQAKPVLGKDGKMHQFGIDEAHMDATFQANEKGQRAFERQHFTYRALEIDHDPEATRMNRPFLVAQVARDGTVFMVGSINPQDFKRPLIKGIDN